MSNLNSIKNLMSSSNNKVLELLLNRKRNIKNNDVVLNSKIDKSNNYIDLEDDSKLELNIKSKDNSIENNLNDIIKNSGIKTNKINETEEDKIDRKLETILFKNNTEKIKMSIINYKSILNHKNYNNTFKRINSKNDNNATNNKLNLSLEEEAIFDRNFDEINSQNFNNNKDYDNYSYNSITKMNLIDDLSTSISNNKQINYKQHSSIENSLDTTKEEADELADYIRSKSKKKVITTYNKKYNKNFEEDLKNITNKDFYEIYNKDINNINIASYYYINTTYNKSLDIEFFEITKNINFFFKNKDNIVQKYYQLFNYLDRAINHCIYTNTTPYVEIISSYIEKTYNM